jgi:Protein of unknown function (DUF2380)
MRTIALILAPAIMLAALAPAGAAETVAPSPVKMAVFPFELEDFSAGAAYVPPDDIDREQLRLSTEEARRQIAASGRYQLVDVSAVNDPAAKAGKLRECDGCEAGIAAGLDADQSMIGIVTRITRMEYVVTYKLRDARSGAIVAVGQTDLRMGANVAWSRGARWLIENRLLASTQDKPPGLAVAEMDYVDTSGEVIDQSADHRRRLRAFEASLRSDLTASGKLRSVVLDCPPNACSVGDIDANQLIAKAHAAGADFLLISAFHKVSTLVQWAKFDMIDVKAQKLSFERLVSFRGDNDEAWRRAEAFIARDFMDREFARPAAAALPRSP